MVLNMITIVTIDQNLTTIVSNNGGKCKLLKDGYFVSIVTRAGAFFFEDLIATVDIKTVFEEIWDIKNNIQSDFFQSCIDNPLSDCDEIMST